MGLSQTSIFAQVTSCRTMLASSQDAANALAEAWCMCQLNLALFQSLPRLHVSAPMSQLSPEVEQSHQLQLTGLRPGCRRVSSGS